MNEKFPEHGVGPREVQLRRGGMEPNCLVVERAGFLKESKNG
jgi:hypothetical protein